MAKTKNKPKRWMFAANLTEVDKVNYDEIKKRWEKLTGKELSTAEIARRILSTVALTPEYDFLFQQEVLFKVDPKEMESIYLTKLWPVVSQLVKVIEDMKKDGEIEND